MGLYQVKTYITCARKRLDELDCHQCSAVSALLCVRKASQIRVSRLSLLSEANPETCRMLFSHYWSQLCRRVHRQSYPLSRRHAYCLESAICKPLGGHLDLRGNRRTSRDISAKRVNRLNSTINTTLEGFFFNQSIDFKY